MIPQLKPDIFRCIAKHLSHDVAPHRSGRTKEDQHLPGDSPEFDAIFQGKSIIIWSIFETPYRPVRLAYKRTFYSMLDEIRICNAAGDELAELIQDDGPILPLFKTVSLGDLTNLEWNNPGFMEMERLSEHPEGNDRKMIPHLLINLPNVDHVCQMTRFGPLSLFPGVYFPSHPPKIFTYHCNHPSVLGLCTDEVGPIVLGAVNRHYYTCTFAVDHMPFANPWGLMQDHTRVAKIIQRLMSPLVTLADDGASVGANTDDVDIGATTLEIYDYVRYRATPPDGRPKLVWNRGHTHRGCEPAATIAPFQASAR
jgi:hypothetical protein